MLEYALVFLITLLLAYAVMWAVNLSFFVPSLFLRSRKFHCIKCGKCCRKLVTIDENDVRLIENQGHSRDDVISRCGPFRFLRRKSGRCVFLKFEGKRAECAIYRFRPGVCRRFPTKRFLGVEVNDWRCSCFGKSHN